MTLARSRIETEEPLPFVDRQLDVPDYELVRVLGSGSFGYVFEAIDHRSSPRRVAVKRVEKAGNTISREYEILSDLKDCHHVVRMLDFYYSRSAAGKLIQNTVFEYMDDNLEHMIQTRAKQRKPFSEREVKFFSYQILKGLEHIHAKNIVHRDLKPENVLFKKPGIVKICDFGSSKYIDAAGKNTPYIVSRYYRAPELIFCVTKYGAGIDIWATGCIIAELLSQEPIFQGQAETEQLLAIFRVLGAPTSREYQRLSELVPYDGKLFEEFPKFPRPTHDNDRFSRLFPDLGDKEPLCDLLSRMFRFAPQERITASQALQHRWFDSVRSEYDKFEKMVLEQDNGYQELSKAPNLVGGGAFRPSQPFTLPN